MCTRFTLLTIVISLILLICEVSYQFCCSPQYTLILFLSYYYYFYLLDDSYVSFVRCKLSNSVNGLCVSVISWYFMKLERMIGFVCETPCKRGTLYFVQGITMEEAKLWIVFQIAYVTSLFTLIFGIKWILWGMISSETICITTAIGQHSDFMRFLRNVS